MGKENTVKAAVIQASPYICDREKTIDKIVELIGKAGEAGAKIILFPEVFIGGYLMYMSLGVRLSLRPPEGRRDFARYYENSILLPSPDSERIGKAVAKAGAYVTVGCVEREECSGTVYCTAAYWGPDGSLVGKHRKLIPTAAERYFWGSGDGSTLKAVETPYGKFSTLICWENYMPLARAALYGKGISIYQAPTMDTRDTWQVTMRHIALESRCFVMTAVPFFTRDAYPADLESIHEIDGRDGIICRGGSAIIDPLGEYLAGPLYGEEGILIADLDMRRIAEAKFDFDPVGHYARPDVLRLYVNETPQPSFIYRGGETLKKDSRDSFIETSDAGAEK